LPIQSLDELGLGGSPGQGKPRDSATAYKGTNILPTNEVLPLASGVEPAPLWVSANSLQLDQPTRCVPGAQRVLTNVRTYFPPIRSSRRQRELNPHPSKYEPTPYQLQS
jgi:hypothetical protein